MIGSLGLPEILVIAFVLLIIFGPRQLPKLAKSMGETVKEWKKAGKEIQSLHDDKD